MSYTIVIDVDNFRAERAYKKGLDELEEIWPQIEAHFDRLEKEALEKKRQEDEEWEANKKVWIAVYDKYEKAKRNFYIEKYNWELGGFFRGPRPVEPEIPDEYLQVKRRFESSKVHSYQLSVGGIKYYESILSNLKRMHTIANAAIGCYRMTEDDVMEMAGWEDGSLIAKIKSEVGL